MDVGTHPNPHPNPYHRKIELQSPLDLAYLQGNSSRSAREKLDLHFPPSASQPATHIPLDIPASSSHSHPQLPQNVPAPEEDDPMRLRVAALVSDFLAQTWANAKHSISINGIDATSLPDSQPQSILPLSSCQSQHAAYTTAVEEREGIDFTYTPFDPTLQKKVASLYAELEQLTTQVAKLRRDAPQRGARTYGENLLHQIDWEDEESRPPRADDRHQPTDTRPRNDVLTLDAVPDSWLQDVSDTYERGLGELRRLGGGLGGVGLGRASSATADDHAGSLTETVGKVQRARTVVLELE